MRNIHGGLRKIYSVLFFVRKREKNVQFLDLTAFQTTKFHFEKRFNKLSETCIYHQYLFSYDSRQTGGSENYPIDFGIRLVVSM